MMEFYRDAPRYREGRWWLSKLVRDSDVYVSPHRAEGFGMNILNAMAVGTPVVVTGETGNMDFCSSNNALLVSVKGERWTKLMPPYDRAKWFEPDVKSLREQMRKAYEKHSTYKRRAVREAEKIRKNWSWSVVVDKIEERIKELF